MNNAILPYDYYPNDAQGRPLFNAYIYIGIPDLDPEVEANQYDIYGQQEDGAEVLLPQPIRTGAGGVPMYNGSPVVLKLDEDFYSIKIFDRNLQQIYYNENVAATLTSSIFSRVIQTVATFADLATTPVQAGQTIWLNEYNSGTAYGGGSFTGYVDATTPNNGTTAACATPGILLKRNLGKVVNIMDFGARGDGVTIESAAIQAAHDSLGSRGGTIYFPPGNYLIGAPIEITKVGVRFVGSGIQSTRLLPYSNALTTSIFKVGNAGGVTLQLQISDFGFRAFTVDPVVENWLGLAIDATTYPLIDSIIENCWFSMSFDTPYCIDGVFSSSIVNKCFFELTGGSVRARSIAGVGTTYNSLITNCIFWRTLNALRLSIGTGARASIEMRDCNIGSHYSTAGIYVESGDLTASDIRFDVSTQWVGVNNCRALRMDGGTATVSNLKVRKIVNGAAGADLAEAIFLQGAASLTLQSGSIKNSTYGILSSSTGTLIVNGTEFEDLSEHGIYQQTNNLSKQIIKGITIVRVGLGAASNKDAVRIKADYGTVTESNFIDDGTGLMRHVVIDATAISGEVKNNTYLGGEGGSPVISSSTGFRCEFPLSAAPAFGSWAAGSVVRFTAPAAGGRIGSVCTTAGSPGTWKSYGAIDP